MEGANGAQRADPGQVTMNAGCRERELHIKQPGPWRRSVQVDCHAGLMLGQGDTCVMRCQDNGSTSMR